MIEFGGWVFDRRLMKARLFSIGKVVGAPFYHRFRFANSMCIYCGKFTVEFRMPWLAGSAKQLHPELFRKASNDTGKGGADMTTEQPK